MDFKTNNIEIKLRGLTYLLLAITRFGITKF